VVTDRLVAQDNQPYGNFTRAYIEVTLEKLVLGPEHSWSAISMSIQIKPLIITGFYGSMKV